MATVPERRTMTRRRRLDLRVTDEQKAQLERAAALRGQTLSGLILQVALREAQQAIRDHDIMTLSARDSLAFAEALLDPPVPAPRLVRALEEHRAEFGDRAQ